MGREPVESSAFEGDISFVDWQGLRAVHRAVAGKPFYEQIKAYMDYWQWDATDFICETGLPSSRHSEIIHGKRTSMRLEHIVAICKGRRATPVQPGRLARRARRALHSTAGARRRT